MLHPLPATMVPPSQRRPGIWRNGILQIMVTRACDQACYGCTQGSNLGGKPVVMSVEQFDQACSSLTGYFGVVGVFGGNPCLHPHFGTLCKILRAHFPFEQRGLWSNNLHGHGPHARVTFNPRVSNINVHLSSSAAQEFRDDWPESAPYVRGESDDSLHRSPWVSMTDLGVPEETRWDLIGKCDINQHWSAMIGVFRGELRAWFCEVAGAMSMLHQDNPDWAGTGHHIPDTGLPVTENWWKLPMTAFDHQVRVHCHQCGIPMRREGQLAIGGEHEEFSQTHEYIARTKARDRDVQIVGIGESGNGDIGISRTDRPATDYLPGLTPGSAHRTVCSR